MKQKQRNKLATRLDIAVIIALSFFAVLLLMLLGEHTDNSYLYNGLLSLFFYFLLLALWVDIRMQRNSLAKGHT